MDRLYYVGYDRQGRQTYYQIQPCREELENVKTTKKSSGIKSITTSNDRGRKYPHDTKIRDWGQGYSKSASYHGLQVGACIRL